MAKKKKLVNRVAKAPAKKRKPKAKSARRASAAEPKTKSASVKKAKLKSKAKSAKSSSKSARPKAKAPKPKTAKARTAKAKAKLQLPKAKALMPKPKVVRPKAVKSRASTPPAAEANDSGASSGPGEGAQAPAFELADQDGNVVSSASLSGQPYVLYFYPKDDTPGCTKQACSFRDAFSDYRERDVEVLGVSADDVASHGRFRDKYDLPFRLLADTDHAVADAYGVWKEKKNYGRTYMGIERTTFLIDEDGRIEKVFPKVKPEGHAEQILGAL